MSISRKMLYFAATLLLAVAFISIGYHLFFVSDGIRKTSYDQISKKSGELIDPNLAAFNGSSMSGNDVLATIGKFPEYDYLFVTKMCPNGFNADSISNDSLSQFYLNPTETFDVKFIQVSDDVVYKILVIQRGCTFDDSMIEPEQNNQFLYTTKQEASLFYCIKQYSLLESEKAVSELLSGQGIKEQDVTVLQKTVSSLETELAEKEEAVLSMEYK